MHFAEAAGDTTVPVYNLKQQEVGQYTLPATIFGVPVRRDILHRVVRWQLAERQQVHTCNTTCTTFYADWLLMSTCYRVTLDKCVWYNL